MNFRTRTLVTLGTTSLVLVVALFLALRALIGQKFAEVERQQAADLAGRVRTALLAQAEGACEKTSDWAAWDDTWHFAEDGNAGYREANLTTPAWDTINLDTILVFDTAGHRKATVAKTPKGTGSAPASLLDEHFRPSSRVIAAMVQGERRSGLLFTKGLAPLAFCSRPVVRTDGTGPVKGAFVMGRFVDESRLAAVAQKTRVRLTVATPLDPQWGTSFATAASGLADDRAVDLQATSDTELVAWLRLSEFGSDRPLVARVSMDRPVHAQAGRILSYSLAALIAFGLVFVAVIMALVERFVLPTLRDKLELIDGSTVDLSATAAQSAATAASEASMVAQVSTTIEEIQETSRASAENAREALAAATDALRINAEARAAMSEAMQVIQVIEQVATIVDSVNELQEQSNLLAVNAGIVAAKAGEQGRGFAVVATELRDLAERSKGATRRIREVILRADDGRRAIDQADGVVGELGRVLDQAASQIREIVAATQQQAAGVQQISDAMSAVAQGGHETSASSRQIESAVTALERLGAQLSRFVGRRTVAARPPERSTGDRHPSRRPKNAPSEPPPPTTGHFAEET